jgi:hypothetical protein
LCFFGFTAKGAPIIGKELAGCYFPPREHGYSPQEICKNLTGNFTNNLCINVVNVKKAKKEMEEIIERKPLNVWYSIPTFLAQEGNSFNMK